jgi:DNA-binding MarR family transcriptional regulator
VPCPTDRRVSFAALTDAGQATLADATTVHAANLRRAFDGFSAGDLRTFDQLLDRLRGARLG